MQQVRQKNYVLSYNKEILCLGLHKRSLMGYYSDFQIQRLILRICQGMIW